MPDIRFEAQMGTEPATFTLNHFHRLWSTGGELILQARFQRNFVWTSKQKAFLVDSLLRGFPVPEIYIQRSTDADGGEVTTVVDGQQRLRSCLTYMDNNFKLPGDLEIGEEWRGKYFSDLADADRKRLREFKFIVRELPSNVEYDTLREVFRRLNTTVVSLNSAELRNAAYSNDFTDLIDTIATRSEFQEIGLFSANDYKRMKHHEFIAEIFDAAQMRAFPNKKEGLSSLYARFDDESVDSSHAVLDEMAKRFGRAISFLRQFAPELRKTRFRNKSDFYSLMTFLVMNALNLDPTNQGQAALVGARLTNLSEQVNAIRSGEPGEWPVVAVDYQRAVQVASSDRLNRMRRDLSLTSILSGVLTDQPLELSYDDDVRTWKFDLEEDSEALDDSDDLGESEESLD